MRANKTTATPTITTTTTITITTYPQSHIDSLGSSLSLLGVDSKNIRTPTSVISIIKRPFYFSISLYTISRVYIFISVELVYVKCVVCHWKNPMHSISSTHSQFFVEFLLQAYRNKGNRSITGNSGAQQQSPGPSTPLNGAPGSPVVMTEYMYIKYMINF